MAIPFTGIRVLTTRLRLFFQLMQTTVGTVPRYMRLDCYEGLTRVKRDPEDIDNAKSV